MTIVELSIDGRHVVGESPEGREERKEMRRNEGGRDERREGGNEKKERSREGRKREEGRKEGREGGREGKGELYSNDLMKAITDRYTHTLSQNQSYVKTSIVCFNT